MPINASQQSIEACDVRDTTEVCLFSLIWLVRLMLLYCSRVTDDAQIASILPMLQVMVTECAMKGGALASPWKEEAEMLVIFTVARSRCRTLGLLVFLPREDQGRQWTFLVHSVIPEKEKKSQVSDGGNLKLREKSRDDTNSTEKRVNWGNEPLKHSSHC